MAELIWFPDAVESLWIKGLGSRISPELKAELKEIGLDLGPPLKTGYPADMITQATYHAARRLFPELSLEQGCYRMGEIAIDQFAYSLLGRALFPMLKVFGARRMLLRMQSNFRTSNNFIEISTTEVAPERYRLDFNRTHGMPYFWKGCADRGPFHAGVTRPSSDVVAVEPDRMSLFYDLRKEPVPPFPGDEVDRWKVAPGIER